ncbi:cation:proton antiporter [Candidatus Flexifilum breve]|uniref:cation:proton antiporter n=1 Tax=Candidatus Flexifilum breve TaxID=3140694 RepID=UPI0031CCB6A6
MVAASRIGGTIARRFHQPRVLGELIIGVILGPTLLDVLHQSVFHGVELQETIKLFAELGVLLLMFIVGLEVNMGELMKVGRVGVIAGFAGAFAPVLLTLPLVLLFQYTWQPALFAGVTLAATSVSISAQVLLELGVLRTKVGNALLATALIDDIVAILLVSLTVAITETDSSAASVDFGSLLSIIVTMALYLVGAFLLAWFILPQGDQLAVNTTITGAVLRHSGLRADRAAAVRLVSGRTWRHGGDHWGISCGCRLQPRERARAP